MSINSFKKESFLKTFFKVCGTSIIISMACLDPGNLEGNMNIAYYMKYNFIWVLLISHVILYFFQEAAIILGTVSELELSKCISLMYPKKIVFLIWIFTEIAIVAADFQEIIGATIAIDLLFNFNNKYISLIIIIFISLFILFIQDYSQKVFEFIFFIFLLLLTFLFMFNFFISDINYNEFFKGFIPYISNTKQLFSSISVFGAIVMPQNLFLQTGLVNLRNNLNYNKKKKLKIFKIEIILIIIISFFINLFFTSTFVPLNKELNLDNAHWALEKKLSKIGKIFWILGLLSSGLISSVSGALTGQIILEGFFNFKISLKLRGIISRLIIIIPCFIIFIWFNNNYKIMIIFNVIQFIQLPFAIIPLLKAFYNPNIVKNYQLSKYKKNNLIILSVILQIFNMFLIYNIISGLKFITIILLLILILIYYRFIYFLIRFENNNNNKFFN